MLKQKARPNGEREARRDMMTLCQDRFNQRPGKLAETMMSPASASSRCELCWSQGSSLL